MLRSTNDPDIDVLRSDMDKSMEKTHSERHERRPDGKNTAEVEGEGCQDAGRRRHPLRPLVASVVHNLC